MSTFINYDKLASAEYESFPFPHTVIDNFLHTDKLDKIVSEINKLDDDKAPCKFTDPRSLYEYNKFAFDSNYGDFLKEVFVELNSDTFIDKLEQITGIKNIIRNDINLRGAGIHRIHKNGFLQLHTDFNSYYLNGVKLDRRINLLIYLNPDWKYEYNGHICLCDKNSMTCIKKISPILNRCLIFNTTKNSIHGHPMPLNVPEHVKRNSIAVYYYTKNTKGEVDFEGDREHCTTWYPQIKID